MKYFASLLCLACALPAIGQTSGYRFEGEASWWWEASADNGLTWSANLLEVPATQSTVRVRASCAFPQVSRYYFGGALIDQVVTGLDNAGLADTISNVYFGFGSTQPIAVRRFGNILKIDDASDALPPGQGAAQLAIFQPSPAVGPYTYDNPVTNLVLFDLHLDGTMGDRLVNAWWRDWRVAFPDFPFLGPAVVIRHQDLNDLDFIFPTLTVHDLTIRVVPAPGAVVLACVCGSIVAKRRRRGGE